MSEGKFPGRKQTVVLSNLETWLGGQTYLRIQDGLRMLLEGSAQWRVTYRPALLLVSW